MYFFLNKKWQEIHILIPPDWLTDCISLIRSTYHCGYCKSEYHWGYYTIKFWHWKLHWKFLWHWKDTETTLQNINKGNHSDNPGLSHWNIFLCCSRPLKSHWKMLHTEKLSASLISFVPRFFSVTLNFQCDFQCQNFTVLWGSVCVATAYT